jgi:hypothetical protein
MRALAFIDLLGFSQMVTKSHDQSKNILNDFYNLTFDIIKNEPDVEGDLFSDSLLAHSSNPALLLNTLSKIYRECLRKNNSYNTEDLSSFFLLPRGGISFGVVDIQSRTEAPNLAKNFIVSPALVHSAKMENQIKGSRLLVADANNTRPTFNWNTNVKSVLYENATFTFWNDFKYSDALWFLDLAKEYDEQKHEVYELIDISIKLIHANSRNSNKVLEQHLQTLRIGLLSYSKFLSPNTNPILTRIIAEFEDDKYWLIWLTLFEMVMQSPDSLAFSSNEELISFYKRVSLKKSWSNVIKEINTPRNEYLKDLLNTFVQELSI